MRLTAAEKYEVIRLVEGSDLSVRHTLRELQVPRATFYTWYRRYVEAGLDGLAPRPSAARRSWNRIPPRVRQRVVDAALATPERTPRELAWQFTDQVSHFLSESSVYRILRAEDLITSPAYVVLSAANRSTDRQVGAAIGSGDTRGRVPAPEALHANAKPRMCGTGSKGGCRVWYEDAGWGHRGPHALRRGAKATTPAGTLHAAHVED